MNKKIIYWLVIILLWIFLIAVISGNLTKAENSLLNMQSYFKKISNQLIGGEEASEETKLETSWYRVCQTGGDVSNPKMGLSPNCEIVPTSGIADLKPYFIKINSDGFRGGEYTFNKPEDTFRIVLLGDSFTFGWGLNLEETFGYRLERILNENNLGTNFEVLNFGVPGMNTVGEIGRFKERALNYKPDLVIIGFVGDDDQSREFDFILANCSSPEERLKVYNQLRNDKRLKDINTFVKQPLEEMIKFSREFNFKILVYIFNSDLEQENFFEEFKKTNDNFYFQKASFNEMDREEYHLHRLDPHPSSIATEKYAQEIYETLSKYSLLPK